MTNLVSLSFTGAEERTKVKREIGPDVCFLYFHEVTNLMQRMLEKLQLQRRRLRRRTPRRR